MIKVRQERLNSWPLLYIKYLKTHEKIHSGGIQFKCAKSDKSFQHQVPWRSMRGPTQERSLSSAKSVQAFLDFKLLEIFKLETHERIHLGNIPFKCTKCNKTTWWDMRPHRREGIQVHKVLQELLYIKLLESHERIHSGGIQFKCTKCDKCFQHQVPWRIMRGPTQGRSLSNDQNVTRASRNRTS